MEFYFAPMEGVTGGLYRTAHSHHFPGIDCYYMPFITPTQDHVFTPRELRNVAPEYNRGFRAVPQILTKNPDDFNWAARELFADIKAGNYPQMSFAFTVAEDHYDKATHTRIIDRIAKVFDVSPVAFPANPTTQLGVATRDYFDGVIEAEKAERLEREQRERQRQKLRILMEVNRDV